MKKKLVFKSFSECKKYVMKELRKSIVKKRYIINDYESLNEYIRMNITSKNEDAFVLYLDKNNGAITSKKIGMSNPGTVVFGITNICRDVFELEAAGIVMIHTHCSAETPVPSDNDNRAMKHLYFAMRICGIEMLDALIIGVDGHYSYHAAGKMLDFKEEFKKTFKGIIT